MRTLTIILALAVIVAACQAPVKSDGSAAVTADEILTLQHGDLLEMSGGKLWYVVHKPRNQTFFGLAITYQLCGGCGGYGAMIIQSPSATAKWTKRIIRRTDPAWCREVLWCLIGKE